MLDPATVRAWALEALSAEGLDTDDQGVLPEEDVRSQTRPAQCERDGGERVDGAVEDRAPLAFGELAGPLTEAPRREWKTS